MQERNQEKHKQHRLNKGFLELMLGHKKDEGHAGILVL